MPERFEYRFRIGAYTPDTIPMARLAEYLGDLSALLGNQDRVHFVRLDESSTTVVHAVEKEAVPKVEARITGLKSKEDAPADLIKAYTAIDARLSQDNSFGEIQDPTGQKVINFPGSRRVKPPIYGPFNQEGELDGVVILIGGKNDPVPVHLEDGGVAYNCLASRDMAKELGSLIFGPRIRIAGVGRWLRNEQEQWEMTKFTIRSYRQIDDSPLSEVVSRMRSIESPFQEMEDPISELLKLRRGPEKIN